MKKLIFIALFILGSCVNEETFPTPHIGNMDYFELDKSTYSIGEQVRMSTGLVNVKRGNDWILQIFLNEDLIEELALKTYQGDFVKFFEHQIDFEGEFILKACLKNKNGEYCRQRTAIIKKGA